ncbi:MAG: hypothetical protein MK538_11900 [Planctomycetes bacterium]|nr:hypothetical protein [Planctomycetota bacterium]
MRIASTLSRPDFYAAGIVALLLFGLLSSCDSPGQSSAIPQKELNSSTQVVIHAPEEGEQHLANIRQLTFSGENAEAYFAADGERLIFQTTHGDLECDQIFVMNTDGSGSRMVSTGRGRTTCSYFFPDGSRIVYASTHLGGKDCPPPPPRSGGYVWAIYDSYDIFSANPDGSDLKRLTETPGYDAEATVSPDGSRIVFTSVRDGDLELYTMNADGSDVEQITRSLGYDRGAFFSPDNRMLCFRASRPETDAEKKKYRELLKAGLVEPSKLEIYICNVDGSDARQVTSNGRANFCPFFHPSGEKLIFASNLGDPKGRNFDLYLIGVDGSNQERVTVHGSFDGFPMFSPDGKHLVWGSNRHNARPRETNIFIAEWVD